MRGTEMMLSDGEAGARHIAENRYVHHYFEGPAERLASSVAEYLHRKNSTVSNDVKNWLAELARVKGSHLRQIFNHDETIEYLTTLREYRPHFHVNEYYSIKFCMKKLHLVHGAVRTVKDGVEG
jgi:hypothetical protein